MKKILQYVMVLVAAFVFAKGLFPAATHETAAVYLRAILLIVPFVICVALAFKSGEVAGDGAFKGTVTFLLVGGALTGTIPAFIVGLTGNLPAHAATIRLEETLGWAFALSIVALAQGMIVSYWPAPRPQLAVIRR